MSDLPGGLSAILASPLMLPGLAAAFLVGVVVIAWRYAQARWFFILGIPIGVAVLAVFAILDQVSVSQSATLRRDLLTREAELTRSALNPGSPLACLAAGAGDTVEAACEKSIFASAQTAAAAVMYVGARLNLLAAAPADDNDEPLRAALAATRRAVELDRFGIAAHVLATRDGCTAEKCGAFDLVGDAGPLKANLRAQVYDQYVSRYAVGWNAPPPAEAPPAVSAIPAAPPGGPAPVAAIKPGEAWDYPSAASIPPVSIMNAEPPTPKTVDGDPANAKQTDKSKQADAASHPDAAAPGKPADTGPPLPPAAPKRPQQQAAPPTTR